MLRSGLLIFLGCFALCLECSFALSDVILEAQGVAVTAQPTASNMVNSEDITSVSKGETVPQVAEEEHEIQEEEHDIEEDASRGRWIPFPPIFGFGGK